MSTMMNMSNFRPQLKKFVCSELLNDKINLNVYNQLESASKLYDFFLKKYKYVDREVKALKTILRQETNKLESILNNDESDCYNAYKFSFEQIHDYEHDLHLDLNIYQMSVEAGEIDYKNVLWDDEASEICNQIATLKFDALFELNRDIFFSIIDTHFMIFKLQFGWMYRGLNFSQLLALPHLPHNVQKIIRLFVNSAVFLERQKTYANSGQPKEFGIVRHHQNDENVDGLYKLITTWSLLSMDSEASEFCKLSRGFSNLLTAYSKLNVYIRFLNSCLYYQNLCAKEYIAECFYEHELPMTTDVVHVSILANCILNQFLEFLENYNGSNCKTKGYWEKYDEHMSCLRAVLKTSALDIIKANNLPLNEDMFNGTDMLSSNLDEDAGYSEIKKVINEKTVFNALHLENSYFCKSVANYFIQSYLKPINEVNSVSTTSINHDDSIKMSQCQAEYVPVVINKIHPLSSVNADSECLNHKNSDMNIACTCNNTSGSYFSNDAKKFSNIDNENYMNALTDPKDELNLCNSMAETEVKFLENDFPFRNYKSLNYVKVLDCSSCNISRDSSFAEADNKDSIDDTLPKNELQSNDCVTKSNIKLLENESNASSLRKNKDIIALCENPDYCFINDMVTLGIAENADSTDIPEIFPTSSSNCKTENEIKIIQNYFSSEHEDLSLDDTFVIISLSDIED